MFTSDFYIDAIQNGKKMLVNSMVQHDGIRTALNNFVDGQTAYTKSAIKVGTEVGTRLAEEAVEAMTQTTNFDLSKFFKVGKSAA
jgi:ribosomal protein L18